MENWSQTDSFSDLRFPLSIKVQTIQKYFKTVKIKVSKYSSSETLKCQTKQLVVHIHRAESASARLEEPRLLT